jgi:cystathionine beta-lyase family protein involved in aluminum resistance
MRSAPAFDRLLALLAEVADRNDFVAANRNRFRVGILRVSGEDFGVEENSFAGVFLSPELGGQKKEWSGE